MMYHEEVAVIQAYDHYSTENPIESECIAEFVGIIVDESSDWLKLKYIDADIKNPNSTREFHNIFKKAIKKIWRFELTQENEKSGNSD